MPNRLAPVRPSLLPQLKQFVDWPHDTSRRSSNPARLRQAASRAFACGNAPSFSTNCTNAAGLRVASSRMKDLPYVKLLERVRGSLDVPQRRTRTTPVLH